MIMKGLTQSNSAACLGITLHTEAMPHAEQLWALGVVLSSE